MSGIDGLNVFGSLTTQNGQRVQLKDFDTDGDGIVTAEEWEQGLKDLELDSLELSTVDLNEDKIVDEDEFAVLEQKADMQTALNELQATIAKDFTGKNAEYAKDAQSQLKEYAADFVTNYTGETKNMAASFKETLPEKYEEIKEKVLSNTPEALAAKKEAEQKEIKSNVIEGIITNISNNSSRSSAVSSAITKEVGKKLEALAAKFIKNYTGDDLETDLREYLNSMLNASDKSKMSDAIAVFNQGAEALGNYIDSDELDDLKALTKTLLTAALDNGITVTLGGNTIKNVAGITTALKKYTDGDELKDDVQSFINALSTDSLLTQLSRTGEANATTTAYKNFTNIAGSEYKIDASLIDYSSISGYFDGGNISSGKYKKEDDAKSVAIDSGRELLNNESLISQMKNQIKSMLEAKGIDFSQVESVFDNVYADTITTTLNQDEIINTKRSGNWLKGHKYNATIDIKTLVDTFITNFNTNMAKAIDDMNSSNTDMDLQDIDYSVLGDEYADLYQNGKTSVHYGKEESYYGSIAENLIENLKSQMLTKARAMCTANGVEFDESAFSTIFNNAKGIAVGTASTDTTIWRFKLSKLNTKTLVDTFTQEFKTSYTDWVNSKKTK